ncbi:DUF2147 domain-containing protein [Bradyrhizobium aeschynomenes]|uniref:DUF2147 domain-containing protein n=1 Tax=Bradyrhizobium aeschynomenes TaxID=2734909 RepID=UPI001555A43B|nr:DUF2147 domain-containing protein [Bradyrhizobium aeschynomenes]NPV20831.1 DUF2147 domain-containing protein [Bradyrhizobium aeschynomenes]
MKTVFLAAAAILIASSAAQAGSSIAFDFDGRKIRVTVPRNCQSLSCLQVSGIDLSGLKSKLDDDDAPATSAPAAAAPAATAPVASSPVVNAPASVATAPAVAPPAPAAPAPVAPPATVQMPVPPAPVTSTATVAAPPPVAAAPAPAPVPTNVAAAPAAQPAPAADPNSPLGLWATEGGKGNVVIEPCGPNICGYAEKTREKILINMKPKDSKWVGRIHDPDGGGNYDSTVVLKNPNTLRVQGCAFGGLFCGGQTWKRVS